MLLESRDSARTRARNEQNRGLNRQHARLDIPRTGRTPIQTIAAPIVCIGHGAPKPAAVSIELEIPASEPISLLDPPGPGFLSRLVPPRGMLPPMRDSLVEMFRARAAVAF